MLVGSGHCLEMASTRAVDSYLLGFNDRSSSLQQRSRTSRGVSVLFRSIWRDGLRSIYGQQVAARIFHFSEAIRHRKFGLTSD